jgi:pimeloyl-ACP methyl ester carboxylesterase
VAADVCPRAAGARSNARSGFFSSVGSRRDERLWIVDTDARMRMWDQACASLIRREEKNGSQRDDGAILIGHSIGGTILIPTLADEPPVETAIVIGL